jgi:DNA-binding NarL/FixJ family response regulator
MRILVVDDHSVVRAGVRQLLATMRDVELHEAASGETALELFRRERPQLVLLDLKLPDMGGLDLLRRMLSANAHVRAIVFTMYGDALHAAHALRLGACGYVSKGAGADQLVAAIKEVANGGHYLEQEIADELAFATGSRANPLNALTPRELEILRLLGASNSFNEIADKTGVSYKTVANSCRIIKSKLGITRTADLIRFSLSLK